MRPMVMSIAITSGLVVCIVVPGLFAACASDAGTISDDGHRDVAERLCADLAAEGADVLGAWSTTVDSVRQHEGGPPPGFSPAARPWAYLAGSEPAAWCTFSVGDSYSVAAATAEGPLVDFMVTEAPPGELPDGPSLP